jgi:hypothetical protein
LLMEPNEIYGEGTIIARIKRADNQALPQVQTMTIGGVEVDKVWRSPNGIIYFVPPEAKAGTQWASVNFDDSTTENPLQNPAVYTSDAKRAAESIKLQLSVLREALKERMTQCDGNHDDSRIKNAIRDEIVKNGHYRFEVALGKLWSEKYTVTEFNTAVVVIEDSIKEHASVLDSNV